MCPLSFFVIFAVLGFSCHHCCSLHKTLYVSVIERTSIACSWWYCMTYFHMEMVAMSNSNPVVMHCQIAPPPYLPWVHTGHVAHVCIPPAISTFYLKYKLVGKGTILKKLDSKEKLISISTAIQRRHLESQHSLGRREISTSLMFRRHWFVHLQLLSVLCRRQMANHMT